MNIHEHQAKSLLSSYGVPVPQGFPAFSVDEAVKAAENLKGLGYGVFVVKAQIHAGGRGKAGGVKVVKTINEVQQIASDLLGKTLVTYQTGPEGQVVRRLYVEAGSMIKKEYYLSLVVDRATSSVVVVASSEGGVEIEEVAHKNPEKIAKLCIYIDGGLSESDGISLANKIGLNGEKAKKFSKILSSLYKLFLEKDAAQIEINPLIETEEGDIMALDAKVAFDENALYRHEDIVALRDSFEENEYEAKAKEFGLNYVKMDGEIGCMVNGAGLAMATMDIIKLHGSSPANFLDVGGGATKEKVCEAFKIILSDKNVKAVLVNIFGGIMRCDIIANGIINAVKEISLNVPLVVRLEGTNSQLGKDILNNSGLAILAANDLEDAAKKVVSVVRKKAA